MRRSAAGQTEQASFRGANLADAISALAKRSDKQKGHNITTIFHHVMKLPGFHGFQRKRLYLICFVACL
jgi:hypothetical protein